MYKHNIVVIPASITTGRNTRKEHSEKGNGNERSLYDENKFSVSISHVAVPRSSFVNQTLIVMNMIYDMHVVHYVHTEMTEWQQSIGIVHL